MDHEALHDLAVEAAHRAGALLLERFRSSVRLVGTKSSATDPVSEADHASEQLLLDVLRDERPDDGILAEEGGVGESRSGLTWVIDPLDGTVNFLFGIPMWAVSIAVEDAHGGVVGVVFDPIRDETFSAIRGEGARLNGARIEVSPKEDLSTALIGTGFSYEAGAREVQAERLVRLLPKVRDIRRAGSAAVDLCWTASGRLDGFFEAPMEVWDKAAGVLIMSEAGAVVSELEAPLDLSAGIIAANPTLHDRLRSLVLG
ncbi:MAG: inositol monophosphatase family protein [Actinomycetota bacterium]